MYKIILKNGVEYDVIDYYYDDNNYYLDYNNYYFIISSDKIDRIIAPDQSKLMEFILALCLVIGTTGFFLFSYTIYKFNH